MEGDSTGSLPLASPGTPVGSQTPTSAPPALSTPGSSLFSMEPVTPASATQQKRRSSTRSIKRKKFDDELVESSLAKTDRSRVKLSSSLSLSSSLPAGSPSVAPGTSVSSSETSTGLPSVQEASLIDASVSTAGSDNDHGRERHVSGCSAVTEDSVTGVNPVVSSTSVSTTATSVSSTSITSTALNILTTPLQPPSEDAPAYVSSVAASLTPTTPTTAASEKKRSKSSSKRSKKSRPPPAASTKDLGRWKPQDDLALINAVQQTCDLTAVFLGVKFSCKFTLKEIQERWYALMYDPIMSKLATQAIKQLHPDIVVAVNSQALFSKEEENLFAKVTSTSQPTVDTFQELLNNNPLVFHPGRTAKSLFNHWLLMKQYHLLPDQSVPPMPKGDHVLNFSDAEDMINDEELKDPRMEAVEHELTVSDRRQKREIRNLEQELPKWQVLVDSVTGISPPDFDNQTLAVLRGRLVRYLMRSREITLGRATKDNQIDVDLSLEGPAWKISRRQGLIKLKNNGDFYIANEGKRPLYIDGKPVLAGNKEKLSNNSVVEISCLRFIFLINLDLINVIRQEATKLSS